MNNMSTSSILNINPLYNSFKTSIQNVPTSIVSQSWLLPQENLECNDGELISYDSSFSVNTFDSSSCELPYGSRQTITYNATFNESENEWANSASGMFDIYVNLPPFGGICQFDMMNNSDYYALSTSINIECKNWMYTHTMDYNYYHKSAKSSYLRYSLKLVSPTYLQNCDTLISTTNGAPKYASYSDIQSTCIGMLLSYDKYSGIISDLYLGTGDNLLLISEIEDRANGAKASFVLDPITVSAASQDNNINKVKNKEIMDKMIKFTKVLFMNALSYSLHDNPSYGFPLVEITG